MTDGVSKIQALITQAASGAEKVRGGMYVMLRTKILGLVGSWAVTDCGQRKALGAGVAGRMLRVMAVTAHAASTLHS